MGLQSLLGPITSLLTMYTFGTSEIVSPQCQFEGKGLRFLLEKLHVQIEKLHKQLELLHRTIHQFDDIIIS